MGLWRNALHDTAAARVSCIQAKNAGSLGARKVEQTGNQSEGKI